jgi:hypothetical protein
MTSGPQLSGPRSGLTRPPRRSATPAIGASPTLLVKEDWQPRQRAQTRPRGSRAATGLWRDPAVDHVPRAAGGSPGQAPDKYGGPPRSDAPCIGSRERSQRAPRARVIGSTSVPTAAARLFAHVGPDHWTGPGATPASGHVSRATWESWQADRRSTPAPAQHRRATQSVSSIASSRSRQLHGPDDDCSLQAWVVAEVLCARYGLPTSPAGRATTDPELAHLPPTHLRAAIS